MKYIEVLDSNGGKWKISGYPFDDWAEYKTCWYKLVKQNGKTIFMAKNHQRSIHFTKKHTKNSKRTPIHHRASKKCPKV